MDTKTITLRKPVVIGDLTYAELNLQEPTVKQLEQASLNAPTGMSVAVNLLAAVAVVPRKVIESLGQRDFKEAADFLDSFNAGDPATGETLSET